MVKITGKVLVNNIEVNVIEGGFGEGQKCMLFSDIAKEHGVEGKHITELINRNISRYSSNDLMDLCNEKFKVAASDLGLITSNGQKHCYLLSERGYIKLVSSMANENEKKWEVMDKVINDFFHMREHIKKENNSKQAENKPKQELECLDVVSKMLKFSDNSTLKGITAIYDKYDMEKSFLPKYVESKDILKSATELLKQFNIDISTVKFNKLMIKKGYLKENTRLSTKNPLKTKKFKTLLVLEYGQNEINPKVPQETQPLYYEHKFKDLLKELGF